MAETYFEFSIGPVQNFIGAARRTRDFWAGSYILAWLSGVALLSAKHHGVVEFLHPFDAEARVAWIAEGGTPEAARLARMPNRFLARVPAGFKARAVELDVREAWKALADHVRSCDLATIASANTGDADRIWERQVQACFEIAWTMGEPAMLSRRKYWRAHARKPEPGVKCMLTADLQELLGVRGTREADRPWKDVVNVTRGDVEHGEWLCAPAFVKRRFARHFGGFSALLPGGWRVHGTAIDRKIPSTCDIAAAPWLTRVLCDASDGALSDLVVAARKAGVAHSGGALALAGVRDAVVVRGSSIASDFAKIEGEALFADRLAPRDGKNMDSFRAALKAVGIKDRPSPFFAMLRMDVDDLGTLVGGPNPEPGARVAKAFAEAVPAIVDAASGFLIYAGGDDTLAMLPMEKALGCAAKLRAAFSCAVAAENERAQLADPLPLTVSAAVLFAHAKMPLGRTVRASAKLLEDRAKIATGKDAIAVRVWKPGGVAAEWSMPWILALDPAGNLELEMIAARIAATPQAGEFSSGFFHKLREMLDVLAPDEGAGAQLSFDDMVYLMAAEYLASFAGATTAPTLEEARAIIQPLLKLCRPMVRIVEGTGPGRRVAFKPLAPKLAPDAALIARFIALGGRERT